MEIAIRNNQRRIKVNPRKVKRSLGRALRHLEATLFTGYTLLELSVFFVSDRHMRKLNRDFRGIDRTTDVLSFPQYDIKKTGDRGWRLKTKDRLPVCRHAFLTIGDIVINPRRAELQAKEHGLSFYEEIDRLLVHGMLHLFGYDHEKNEYQARKMRKMESSLLESIRNAE